MEARLEVVSALLMAAVVFPELVLGFVGPYFCSEPVFNVMDISEIKFLIINYRLKIKTLYL